MRLTAAQRQAAYRARHPDRVTAYKVANSKRQGAEYRANNPEARKESWKKYRASEKYRITSSNNHLKRLYGITYAEYLEMLAAQGGVCKICLGTNPRKSQKRDQLRPLFVDHCHKTKKVRGLLCNLCNHAIGAFKENTDAMTRAISYLKESQNF